MAADQEHFDDGDEAQVAWLLSSTHHAPEMRAEFADSLAKQLDAEFLAAHGGAAERNGSAVHLANGVAKAIHLNGTHHNGVSRPDVPPGADDDQVTLAPQRAAAPRRSRWLVATATAASLVVAAAVLSDPPAWAAVFRAIVQGIGEWTGVGGADQVGRADDATELSEDGPPAAALPGAGAAHDAVAIDAPKIETIASNPRSIVPSTPPAAEPVPQDSVATEPLWEPKAEENLTGRIDEQLAALWTARGIQPVAASSDAEFMRRAFLDLTGRIPTVTEAREFLEDPSPDRREKLVDRLLEHHDHATHLAAVWRQVLIPDDVDLSRYGGAAKFEEWLSERFAENKPYNEIVEDLLLAEGRISESGPLLFYAALRLNPEELAARSSRAFLGVRMECAQCHDHFFDDSIKQHDFWSFAAFFARISRPRGKMEMTSPVLAVRDNQHGDVMIPDSEEIVAPRLPNAADGIVEAAEGPSRRKQLADWLTSKHNGQFARATVNRVWAHLFGRGLVEPVDDMRPANAAIAPEVLDTLSRDFAASGFDLRRLLRALVLTQAYQLSSQTDVDDPSRALHFAQMNVKSFTAEQLYDCIAVATQRATVAGGPASEGGLQRFADSDRQTFLTQFRAPVGQATDYHAGIPQALTLMHGGLIHGSTDLSTSGLLKSLAAPFFSDEGRLDALFLSTLSRYPAADERELMLEPIAAAKNDEEKQQALGDVLWALLNSAEFTFNH